MLTNLIQLATQAADTAPAADATTPTESEVHITVDNAIPVLLEKLSTWTDTLIKMLPNIAMAAVVMVAFWFVSRWIAQLVNRGMRHVPLKESLRALIFRIVRLVILFIGVFIALRIMNLSTVLAAILGGVGVLGLAFGFAVQGTLNNTFAGIILSFIPQVKLGQWVETGDFEGRITDINLRNIMIKQADNNFVMIPNSQVLEQPFKNYSLTQRTRIFVECGVGYESDLEAVKALTEKTIEGAFPQSEAGEEVEFFYKEFGDSSINFVVRFWADAGERKQILHSQSQAILAIKKAFDANDINIPFPIRTLDFGKNKFRSEAITINQGGSNEDTNA